MQGEFPHGFLDRRGRFYPVDMYRETHVDYLTHAFNMPGRRTKAWRQGQDMGLVRLDGVDDGIEFLGTPRRADLERVQDFLMDQGVRPSRVNVDLPRAGGGKDSVVMSFEDFMAANSVGKLKRRRRYEDAADNTQDDDAERMIQRYQNEPESIWLYSDLPMRDRIGWAYLAADEMKQAANAKDIVAEFEAALQRVIDEPETFWAQISAIDPQRADYLRNKEWTLARVRLDEVGVYPRFSSLPDEYCRGSVADTAAMIIDRRPPQAEKLLAMSERYHTLLKFLPPILVPGGTLRGRRPEYEQLAWDIDDGNHRLVAAAMTGETEALCFTGHEVKGEPVEESEVIPCGDCFRFANNLARTMLDDGVIPEDDIKVVHALVWDWDRTKQYPHAWVEAQGRAYDWQMRQTGTGSLPIKDFYEFYEPENVERYTPIEAMVQQVRSRHHGPWTESLEESFRVQRRQEAEGDRPVMGNAGGWIESDGNVIPVERAYEHEQVLNDVTGMWEDEARRQGYVLVKFETLHVDLVYDKHRLTSASYATLVDYVAFGSPNQIYMVLDGSERLGVYSTYTGKELLGRLTEAVEEPFKMQRAGGVRG